VQYSNFYFIHFLILNPIGLLDFESDQKSYNEKNVCFIFFHDEKIQSCSSAIENLKNNHYAIKNLVASALLMYLIHAS